MVGLIGLFIVVFASLLVTRVATSMLVLTGLSREVAAFQARSAFSGTGFTTVEAETVVNHPVRRRIISTLVLLGNAGVVTALVSVVISFSDVDNTGDALGRLGLLALGLSLLWFLSTLKPVERLLSRAIEWALRKFTHLDATDYTGLLRLGEDWMVGEVPITGDGWLAGAPLSALRLNDEGVVVLGIERADGRWVGSPKGNASMHTGDTVVLYGPRATIDRLGRRPNDAEGELDHLTAQVEFTEQFLEQQESERDVDTDVPDWEPELVIDDEHDPEIEALLDAVEDADDGDDDPPDDQS